jgi:mutator protein MutT
MGPRARVASLRQRPIVGVGGVVVTEAGVVLVRRRHEPLAGVWSLPGGRVEFGETLKQALRRELHEETGLEVAVGPLIALLDRIHRDDRGRVTHHFVLADYLCRVTGGVAEAGSDATALAIVAEPDLAAYDLPAVARDVISRGLEMVAQWEIDERR